MDDTKRLLQSYWYKLKTKNNIKVGGAILFIFLVFLVRKSYLNENFDDSEQKELTVAQLEIENATSPRTDSASCKHEVFLLILVLSKPTSFKRRDDIRDSWAFSYQDDYAKLKDRKSFPNGKHYLPRDVVKTVFIIGRLDEDDEMTMNRIRDESRLSKDLVFGDVVENYRNLTLKTKLALKWAAHHCKSAYVMKTDDDVFVNPVVLVEWLKGMPTRRFYSGSCNSNSPVIRDKTMKWYLSYDDYKEETLPDYCVGGGYLMSEDLMLKVVKKSYGRKQIPLEDLYVGLMVKELGVQPRDEKRHFIIGFDETFKQKSDCFMKNVFLAHRVVGQRQFELIKKTRAAFQKC